MKLGPPPADVYEELRQAAERLDWKFCADLTRFTLTCVSADAHPEHWVRLKTLLGQALMSLPTGDRAANVEEAIAAVQDAIATSQRLTESSSKSTLQALARQLLGHLYLNRVRGDRAQNIEDAIGALEQLARESASRSDLSAMAMRDLSVAYFQRARGDRSQNLERALAASQTAAEIASGEGDRAGWYHSKLSNAWALAERSKGDREDNLDQALAAVDDALGVVTREGAPFKWAMAMHTRATVLRNRVRGGRAENQEDAINAYSQALEVFTRDGSRVEWANSMFGLGATCAERLRGDRRSNLEAAARALSRALEVLEPYDDLEVWANVSNSLGIVYAEAARRGGTANLERSIDVFGRVLTVLPRERNPEQWAQITRNLGVAYLDRHEGDRADNVERAIVAFTQALEVFTREAARIEWAQTLANLGLAYQLRLRGEDAQNAESARSALEHALEVFTLDAFPSRHAWVQRALAHPRFDEGKWADAYEAYAAALKATRLLYGSSVVPDARLVELQQSQGVPARAAYALCHLGRAGEAVALLEEQAAQALSQVLARNEAALRDACDADRDAFSRARARIDTLEAAARREGQREKSSTLTVVSELRQAHRSLQAIAERIRAYVPQFMPESMTVAEIGGLSRALEQPIVYLFTTSHGSVALVVPPESARTVDVDTIWLDEFTTGSLDGIMDDRAGGAGGYLHQVAGGGPEDDPAALMRVLDEAWPRLNRSLMGPVTQRLLDLGFSRAVIVARGTLALLPLHVVSEAVDFTFAPSARALEAAMNGMHDRVRHPPLLVGIGNTLGAGEQLPFANQELRAVASHFQAASRRTMEGAAATRSRLLKQMPGATHVHFACHAVFNHLEPLMSCLGLAGEDRLTLLDMLEGVADLSATRLVVLSACQTGLADFRGVPSEAIGFPAACLQSGVPGVVSTLWPGDDISTAVLMEKFYELLLRSDLQDGGEPLPPAAALRSAQDWLRRATAYSMELAARYQTHYEQTGDLDSHHWMDYYVNNPNERSFAHPYYWACFTFTGV
jgi:hypothetical protein